MTAETDVIHEFLTDVLDEWPIGEPYQEISRSEAVELSRFILDCLARRGVSLRLTPTGQSA